MNPTAMQIAQVAIDDLDEQPGREVNHGADRRRGRGDQMSTGLTAGSVRRARVRVGGLG